MNSTSLHFDEQAETASQDELRSIQNQRLRAVVGRVYEKNETQRARFRAAGIEPGDIKGLDDLPGLPTMDKALFRDNYPLGLSCVDKQMIAEMHMSSGSTGVPVVMPYTQGDLNEWADCMARCLCMAGAQSTDVIQITPSFGLFNGGFGFYHGAEALGLFVLPTGAGNTRRQIRLATDLSTRIMTGVVSYGVRIMEVLQEEQEVLPDLEIGIFGGETFSDAMKKKLSEGLGAEIFDIYGMTETGGVGTLGMDCPAHDGLHVWEDKFLVELNDPETGAPVPDGQEGELVVTALSLEALPVIRLKTGDLTRVVSRERCACGRTHIRIAPIIGRTDDMLMVKGVNFFPSQVEHILMEMPGVGSNYQIIIEDIEGIKDIRINVEAESGVTGFAIEKHLKEALGFSPKGDVFPLGSLPRQQEGKSQHVFYKDTDGTLR